MNPLLLKYLKALVGNLAASAVATLILNAVFEISWLTVFLILAGVAVGLNTIGVAVTYFTLRGLSKKFVTVSYVDLYDAYVKVKLHKSVPMNAWTPQIIHTNVALHRATGGKPLF